FAHFVSFLHLFGTLQAVRAYYAGHSCCSGPPGVARTPRKTRRLFILARKVSADRRHETRMPECSQSTLTTHPPDRYAAIVRLVPLRIRVLRAGRVLVRARNVNRRLFMAFSLTA